MESFSYLADSSFPIPLTMRKLTFLIAIIINPALSVFSQNISSKSLITLSAGPSMPIGDYGKTDKENIHSGFSNAGISASISYNYKLNKTIGLEAMVFGQRNSLNTSAVERNLSETGFLDQQQGYYSNWSVDKKNWQIGSVMLGATSEFPSSNSSKLSFSGKILFGLAYVKSPDLKADSRQKNAYTVFSGEYGSNTGPSWLVSPGVNYKLSNRFNLILNAAYFGTSKISFKDATEIIAATNGGLIEPGLYDLKNSVNPPTVYGEKRTRKQSINSINLNLGVSFQW